MKKQRVFLQGHISETRTSLPLLQFRVSAVALEDQRFQKLRKQPENKPRRKGHIKEGDVFMLKPSKNGMKSYILLDTKGQTTTKNDPVIGAMVKSKKYHTWWQFINFKPKA